jgi:Zn finger protein HypA/HybF involved in hydrogenase expression
MAQIDLFGDIVCIDCERTQWIPNPVAKAVKCFNCHTKIEIDEESILKIQRIKRRVYPQTLVGNKG